MLSTSAMPIMPMLPAMAVRMVRVFLVMRLRALSPIAVNSDMEARCRFSLG